MQFQCHTLILLFFKFILKKKKHLGLMKVIDRNTKFWWITKSTF